MPTLPNPAEPLAAAISKLYQFASSAQLPPDSQQSLLSLAHALRLKLVDLVSRQFAEKTEAYKTVMSQLHHVTSALNAAEQDIKKTLALLSDIAQLVRSLDLLLEQAARSP